MKKSSVIKTIDWMADTLIVVFKNDSTYTYADVPEQVYLDFVAAESKGKFFAANVNGKYVATKAPERKLYTHGPARPVHGSDVEGAWPFPTGEKP